MMPKKLPEALLESEKIFQVDLPATLFMPSPTSLTEAFPSHLPVLEAA